MPRPIEVCSDVSVAVMCRLTVGWVTFLATLALLAGAIWALPRPRPDAPASAGRVTLSIVGTTDLHGRVFPSEGRGGLEQLGGYLHNLREARARDGGAVLLLDAGDTFQGGIESNLSEGALVVDAYNALGYDALAVGNHEFEFGALDTAVEDDERSDMRGALKAAAARAMFPFLAANLINEVTGRPVDWPNIRPSTIVDTSGLRVGIVGVMTHDGLTKTLAANVQGLRTAALVPTVEAEARRLRQRGTDVVVVLAHAGGRCEQFDDPADLSSCDNGAEIFRLARQLSPGLVDTIVAGHSHAAVAHEVAGIPIVQAYSWGRAFARVDLTFERGAGVVSTRLFSPQAVCAAVDADGACGVGDGAAPPHYEGDRVEPAAFVAEAMQPALKRVDRWRNASLGAALDTPLVRNRDGLESPLGNLFADALRAAVPGADVAIGLGARRGGLRADLPRGLLTRGPLYDTYPFDNRVVTLQLTGTQLERILAGVVGGAPRGLPSVSGVRVRMACREGRREVDVLRSSGAPVGRSEALIVATTDFFARFAARVSFDSAGPLSVASLAQAPLVRNAVADWVTTQGRRLRAADLSALPRWEAPNGAVCLAAD